MSEPLTQEQLDELLANVPPLSAAQAAKVSALLQAGVSPHRPVLRHVRGMNRVDCTCGLEGLAMVKPQAGMAPVLKAMQRHRLEQS